MECLLYPHSSVECNEWQDDWTETTVCRRGPAKRRKEGTFAGIFFIASFPSYLSFSLEWVVMFIVHVLEWEVMHLVMLLSLVDMMLKTILLSYEAWTPIWIC